LVNEAARPPGVLFIMDNETFESLGRSDIDRRPQLPIEMIFT